MRTRPLLLVAAFILGTLICGFTAASYSDYPKPSDVENLLFYTQRSTNINTVIYALNLDEHNKLNEQTPIKVYWINYATDKSKEPLNMVERRRAYGVESELTDAKKGTYRFNFVAYKKRPMYLMRSPSDNKYHAFCHINNELAVLNKIFIRTENTAIGAPKPKSLELIGTVPGKSEEVNEVIDLR